MDETPTPVNLEEICKLVSSGKAVVVRYKPKQGGGLESVPVEHPENITNDDVLLLNRNKEVMKRKAYKIECAENNGFFLTETYVLFGREDVEDVWNELKKNYGLDK